MMGVCVRRERSTDMRQGRLKHSLNIRKIVLLKETRRTIKPCVNSLHFTMLQLRSSRRRRKSWEKLSLRLSIRACQLPDVRPVLIISTGPHSFSNVREKLLRDFDITRCLLLTRSLARSLTRWLMHS